MRRRCATLLTKDPGSQELGQGDVEHLVDLAVVEPKGRSGRQQSDDRHDVGPAGDGGQVVELARGARPSRDRGRSPPTTRAAPSATPSRPPRPDRPGNSTSPRWVRSPQARRVRTTFSSPPSMYSGTSTADGSAPSPSTGAGAPTVRPGRLVGRRRRRAGGRLRHGHPRCSSPERPLLGARDLLRSASLGHGLHLAWPIEPSAQACDRSATRRNGSCVGCGRRQLLQELPHPVRLQVGDDATRVAARPVSHSIQWFNSLRGSAIGRGSIRSIYGTGPCAEPRQRNSDPGTADEGPVNRAASHAVDRTPTDQRMVVVTSCRPCRPCRACRRRHPARRLPRACRPRGTRW